jgi:hypothetical protein
MLHYYFDQQVQTRCFWHLWCIVLFVHCPGWGVLAVAAPLVMVMSQDFVLVLFLVEFILKVNVIQNAIIVVCRQNNTKPPSSQCITTHSNSTQPNPTVGTTVYYCQANSVGYVTIMNVCYTVGRLTYGPISDYVKNPRLLYFISCGVQVINRPSVSYPSTTPLPNSRHNFRNDWFTFCVLVI